MFGSVFELRAQVRDHCLGFLVLLVAGCELLTKLLDLSTHVRELLFLLRFSFANRSHCLFRGREFLRQVGIFRDQRLYALRRFLHSFYLLDRLIALARNARKLIFLLGQCEALGIALFLRRRPAFIRHRERFL